MCSIINISELGYSVQTNIVCWARWRFTSEQGKQNVRSTRANLPFFWLIYPLRINFGL